MQSNRQFTIVGLIVAVVVLAVGSLILLLPSLLHKPRDARFIVSQTQLRGIHLSMVLFAKNNNGYYPGLNRQGEADMTSTRTEDPLDPANRFVIIINNRLVSPEYLISPFDEDKTPWTRGPPTHKNYSFALLNLPESGGRRDEWRKTDNPEAAIASDRAVASDDGLVSVYPREKGRTSWHGAIAWNDNHVTTSRNPVIDTRYGNNTNTNDNLFTATSNNDAAMAYGGVDDYVDGD